MMQAALKQGSTGLDLQAWLGPSPTQCPRRKGQTYTVSMPVLFLFPDDHQDLALIKD